MRFIFTPPADAVSGMVDLPWHLPLEDWDGGGGSVSEQPSTRAVDRTYYRTCSWACQFP